MVRLRTFARNIRYGFGRSGDDPVEDRFVWIVVVCVAIGVASEYLLGLEIGCWSLVISIVIGTLTLGLLPRQQT